MICEERLPLVNVEYHELSVETRGLKPIYF